MRYPIEAYPLGYESADLGYYATGTGPALSEQDPPIDENFVDAELEYLWKHQNTEQFQHDLEEAIGETRLVGLANALRHGTAQDVRRELDAVFTRYWDARIRTPGYQR